MFAAATGAVLLSMAMLLVRASWGPTVYDRILALNSFGTKTVLLISVLNFMTGRPEFLDLALVYAMMNFISTIAVMKYCRFDSLVASVDGATPPEMGRRNMVPENGELPLEGA